MTTYANFGPSLGTIANNISNGFEIMNSIAAASRLEDSACSNSDTMNQMSLPTLVSQSEQAVVENARSHAQKKMPSKQVNLITRAEADQLSQIPPGDTLTFEAEQAYNRGEIPNWTPDYVRIIDGKWMVPDRCST